MPISSRKTVRRARAVAAVAALALLAAGCGGDDDTTTATGADGSSECDQPFEIGLMLGLTGVYAAVAEPQKNAIELFVEQLNADGGINGHQVETTLVDTTSDEGAAVNALRKLATEDEVIAVVGPSSSGEAIALTPIAESLKVPTMAIAASNAIIADSPAYMFKQFPASVSSLEAQLTHAKAEGMTDVGLLYSNNGYGQEAAEALPDLAEELGITVTASEAFPPAATDVTPQLSAVARSNPDTILVWAVNPANAIAAKNAQALGLEATLFQAPGAASAAYLELGGDAVEGTLVQASKILVPESIPADDPQSEVVSSFAEAYQSEYGGPASQFGGGAYDAMLLVAEALEAGDVSPCDDLQAGRDALKESLETNIDGLPGVIAVYSLSADQHGPEGIEGQAVLTVEGGAFTLVGAS